MVQGQLKDEINYLNFGCDEGWTSNLLNVSAINKRYFNFPIQLLQGFLINPKTVLNNIFDYAIINHSRKLEGDKKYRLNYACKYFRVIPGDNLHTIENGQLLNDSLPENSPKVGINSDIYFDYLQHSKTEFEKAVLLAFLAIKSILGKDKYKKIDNAYLLARMDGKVQSVKDYSELSKEIFKYSHPYAIRKLKSELRNNWGLKEYSRYTRGFYVSFSMSMDELVFQAEKRRKSIQEINYKQKQDEAVKKALLRLNVKDKTSVT